MYAKKKIFGILAHLIVRLIMLIDNSVVTCEEIIDAVAKSYNNVSDNVSINLNGKKQHAKWKIITIYSIFISNHIVIRNHYYLLLLHTTSINISAKTKIYINNIKLEKNNELKEISMKNHVCYYFDDTININDPDLDNIFLDEK